MKMRHLTVGALALSAVSAASADFLGWSAEVQQIGGYYVMNVYATSNGAGDIVTNVHGLTLNIKGFGSFHQDAQNPYWNPSGDQNASDSLDSWLTLGTKDDGSAHEGTIADAGLLNFDGSAPFQDYGMLMTQDGGGGWGVGVPNQNVNVTKAITGSQGAQGPFGVLVAHFVVAISDVSDEAIITFTGSALFNEDVVTDSQTFAFVIPAPGAVALLGLGGLVAWRRRRA